MPEARRTNRWLLVALGAWVLGCGSPSSNPQVPEPAPSERAASSEEPAQPPAPPEDHAAPADPAPEDEPPRSIALVDGAPFGCRVWPNLEGRLLRRLRDRRDLGELGQDPGEELPFRYHRRLDPIGDGLRVIGPDGACEPRLLTAYAQYWTPAFSIVGHAFGRCGHEVGSFGFECDQMVLSTREGEVLLTYDYLYGYNATMRDAWSVLRWNRDCDYTG
ncbi:MAG: hypothetical protein KC619_30205 [Myxococcales bacterium]|nr:hypothetical protein [Myxococcales bacterium]